MNTENLSTLKIHKLTQEQYNRELVAGNIDPSALYLTPDSGNADTLDGKHADEFATKTEVETQINNAINNHYDYGTTDLTAGSSSLATGKLYFVYE